MHIIINLMDIIKIIGIILIIGFICWVYSPVKPDNKSDDDKEESNGNLP